MWIILLDRSGSMAEGFSAPEGLELPNRSRVTDLSVKWDAAVEALLSEVGSLQANEEIALFLFANVAELVFQGRAGELDQLRRTLARLGPDGGTDIAAALQEVANYVSDLPAQYFAVSMITDGLSDAASAHTAAIRLAERVGMIDVILIDPTEEGLSVANAVAQRGRVTLVRQSRELTEQVQETSERMNFEQGRLAEVMAKIAEEKEVVVSEVDQQERLHITTGYPGSPERDIWYEFLVMLHLRSSKKEVEAKLARLAKEAGQEVSQTTQTIKVLRGTFFTLIPKVNGVQFNPLQQEVAWLEDLQKVPFRFKVEGDTRETSLRGTMEIIAHGVCVAEVRIAFQVGANISLDEDYWETSSAAMFDQVFASYSRKDTAILEACAAAYKLLGIFLFIDHQALLGGQEWHPAILQKIDDSGAFLLFWSSSSRLSSNVTREWEHALKLRSQKGALFLRPLFWEKPKPEVPLQLDQLNFRYLDLKAFDIGQEQEETTVAIVLDDHQLLSPKALMALATGVRPVVLPLIPGSSRQMISDLTNAVACAVVFLESVTGLRYYPVPTLIIDKLIIRKTRETQQIIDQFPEDQQPGDAAHKMEGWRDILQGLLLDFHCRKQPPFKAVDELLYKLTLNKETFDGIRQTAEWCIHRWFWEKDHCPWDDRYETAPVIEQGVVFSEKILNRLNELVEITANTTIWSKVSVYFSGPTSSDPSQFDERRGWLAAKARLQEPKMTENRSANSDRESYEVICGPSDWVAILKKIREILAAELPSYDHLSYFDGDRGKKSIELIGLAILADKIITRYHDWSAYDQKVSLGEWVTEWIYPSWCRVRDWINVHNAFEMDKDFGFRAFMDCYLHGVEGLLQSALKKYRNERFQWLMFSAEGLAVFKENYPNLYLLGVNQYDKPSAEGTYEQFIAMYTAAAAQIIAHDLESKRDQQTRQAMQQKAQQVIAASLYGAFIAANSRQADSDLMIWANENQVPPQYLMHGTAKVLFAAEANDESSDGTTALLRQCTLIHEHWHAILETGIGSSRKPKAFTLPLNESLAVWMEWHFLREYGAQFAQPEEVLKVKGLLWNYILSAEYPAWPYRGAERVERLFKGKGWLAIKELIMELRTDPKKAQAVFDQLV